MKVSAKQVESRMTILERVFLSTIVGVAAIVVYGITRLSSLI